MPDSTSRLFRIAVYQDPSSTVCHFCSGESWMELGLLLPELAAETQLAVKQTPLCFDKPAFAFNLNAGINIECRTPSHLSWNMSRLAFLQKAAVKYCFVQK